MVLAVLALMTALTLPVFTNLFQLNLKSTASQLASRLRYLYNKAATERRTLRLVYDLEENKYWVEAATGEFLIPSAEEEALQESEAPSENPTEGEEEAPTTAAEGFIAEESFLLEPTTLDDGVFFKNVFVSYREGAISSGKIYTYFFPNGFATQTIINLRDEEDETHYSLKLLPLSGRVKIEGRYVEPEK